MTAYPPCAFCRALQATTFKTVIFPHHAGVIRGRSGEIPTVWMPTCSACYGYLQAVPYAYLKYLAALAWGRVDGR